MSDTRTMQRTFKEPDKEAVRSLLQTMARRSVLVIGDGMLDSYIYGTSSRISPEAPVQIVQAEREENLLGGAANVAKCLVALGAKVTLCCVVGKDAQGELFIEEARSLGIDTRLIFQDASRPTTVKTRVVSGRQHLLRIDREGRTPISPKILKQLLAGINEAAKKCDALLLSDYDKGVLNERVCCAATEAAGKKPVVVDPKGSRWQRYQNATVLKPNWKEATAFLATREGAVLTPAHTDIDPEQVAHQIREALNVKNVLVTRSEHGFTLGCADGSSLSLPTRARSVEDEAGAGDVFAAGVCLALAAGASVPLAAWLGNVAAGAKVAKFATHTVSDHEILEVLGEQFPTSERKIFSAAQAAQYAASLRAAGKKVVFTNGCFDILHLGHVTYLENARRLGDALLVGINTDESVRRLKGPERPLNPENDRARVIASQACVDGVILFGDDTPLELIKAVKPSILCKGADYKTKQEVVGWDVVEAHGGKVVLIDLVEGRSTSKVIEQARKQNSKPARKPKKK